MTIAAPIAAPSDSIALPDIAGQIGDFVALRRQLHAQPELAFQERKTAELVAGLLAQWGFRVSRLAGTGLVASLENGTGPRLGIRADMDALPITEETGLDHASRVPGVMHACGHDGHTAILLAAARHLSQTRRFRGTLRLIFQPAEEIGTGARTMIEQGLFRDHPVDAIFGLHNWPGEPAGRFGFVEGPAMAAIDRVEIRIAGKGGHGAEPHLAVDPVVAAAQAISTLQSIVSRNVDPLHMAVVTVGSIHGGSATNVIPAHVDLGLSLRSYDPDLRIRLRERVSEVAHLSAAAHGGQAQVRHIPGFPSLINDVARTRYIRDIAIRAFGADAVIPGFRPRTASEDFAYYLHHSPGSFVFVGNGDSAPLHSPEYRFNDDIIAPAAALWVALAENFLTGEPDV